MIIDAHQHVWDLDRVRYDWLGPHLPLINKTFTQDDAEVELRAAGIDGVVLVQAAGQRRGHRLHAGGGR